MLGRMRPVLVAVGGYPSVPSVTVYLLSINGSVSGILFFFGAAQRPAVAETLRVVKMAPKVSIVEDVYAT